MTDQQQQLKDTIAEVAYVVEYGTTPEADAVRLLRKAMCAPYGRNLVEHGLVRPFGFDMVERKQTAKLLHESVDAKTRSRR